MATLDVRSLTRAQPAGSGHEDVSIRVPEGRISAVLGAAGSGKTALLRLIAGLDRPDRGDVLLDELSILGRAPHRRGVGLMFQDLALFPHLTVRENIAFGLRMVGWPRAAREQRVNDLLEVTGLGGVQHDAIDDLTAGDRQRVALARTLAPHPSVLLLDEPLGTTDEAMKPLLRQELRSILTALDATAIVATRDVNDAASVADDLVVLDEGRVLQTGPIGVVLGEPASVRVADLVGYLTLAHGTVRRGRVEEPGVGAMAVPGLPATEAARIMAHPAALLAVPADSGLGSGVAGLVVRSRAFGPTWTVDLSVGGRLVEARWEWDLVAPRVGSRLAIAARPGTLRVFPSTLAEIAGAIPRAAPSAPVPATATPASATPAMPTASDALVEAIAADLAPEPPTAPTPPVAPTAPAPHLEPPASAMPPAARTQQPLPPMPAPPSSAVPPPAAPPAPPAEAPPAPPIDVAPLTPAEHRAAEPPSRRAKSRCSGRRDRCPRSPLRHPRPRPCRRHVAVCARPCPRPSEVSSDTDRCRCTSVRSRCSATPSTGRKRRE